MTHTNGFMENSAQACNRTTRPVPHIRYDIAALLAFAVAPAFFFGPAVHAQPYPSKPVRIISPYAPGGGNDIYSRLVAQKLTPRLGQTVLVENKPGANSIIGTELVAKSPPDGYTLILLSNSHVINQSLYPKLPYDAVRDFTGITLAGASPMLLAVSASSPITNLRELIAAAQAKPDQLTYSTAGSGTNAHLAAVMLALSTGIKLQHVPFKGTAPALVALLGNQVTMSLAPPTTFLPQIRAGKLRAIGMSSAERSLSAPDIPTIAESGVKGFAVVNWYGFLGPANMPKAIVDRLNAEIGMVLKDPETHKMLTEQGIDPFTSTPEEFARVLVADAEKWARVVNESGAKVD